MLKIASWNINSVRLRLPIVERFLAENDIDILCLQEIKCQEQQFPARRFAEIGYPHIAVHGQKGYHGVATVSRVLINDFSRHDWQDNGEARHVGVEIPGIGQGMILENVYVPAGGDIPDREQNVKFGQKLDFLERMTRWADKVDRPTMIVGDFNIAPLECDVWNHKQLLKVVSHTPVEVEHLGQAQEAGRWVDVTRADIPQGLLYSWWSYRARDWDAADKGRRLDHIWATPDISNAAHGSRILRAARGWEKPSDHAPVFASFDL